MEFIGLSQFVFFGVEAFDFIVGASFIRACVEFVEHAHLLNVEIFFVEELCGLDAASEHGGPDAEMSVLDRVAAVVVVGGRVGAVCISAAAAAAAATAV